MPRVVRAIKRMPSRAYVHDLNNRLHVQVLKLEEARIFVENRNKALTKQIARLEQMQQDGIWESQSMSVIHDLRSILHTPIAVAPPHKGRESAP